MPVPTTDQIREQIDSGRTAEKVAMPDPAAAPLGTDAEAGGNSATAEELVLEQKARAAAPAHEPRLPGPFIYVLLVLVVAAALLSVIAFALQQGAP
jgi:hypothetical protein